MSHCSAYTYPRRTGHFEQTSVELGYRRHCYAAHCESFENWQLCAKDNAYVSAQQFHEQKLYGFHGVGTAEKRCGQRFIVDATLYLPLGRAGKSDNLSHTVNYVSVLRDLEKIMKGPSVDLIEHLADLMCYRILQGYPIIQSIRVSIKKPDAPLPFPTDSFDCVGVTLHRKREDFDRVPSSYDLDSDTDDDHDLRL